MKNFVVKFSNTTAKEWKDDINCLYYSITLPYQTAPVLISKTESDVKLLYKHTILYPLVVRDKTMFENKVGFYLSRLFSPILFNKYQGTKWYYQSGRSYGIKLDDVKLELNHKDICIPNQEWTAKNVTSGKIYTKLLEVFNLKFKLNGKIFRPILKLVSSNIRTTAFDFRASWHTSREIFFGTKQDAEAAVPFIVESSPVLETNKDYIKTEICKKSTVSNWVKTKVKSMNNTYISQVTLESIVDTYDSDFLFDKVFVKP